jgi:hypothetical protein
MTTTDAPEKKLLPPYLPYRTFKSFIESLRQAVPGRIDRSLMGSRSGTEQGSLLKALRYMSLITENGTPTDLLIRLATSEGAEWASALDEALCGAYGFLFEASAAFDLKTATFQQFEERFKDVGVSGDTVRKCSTFFIGAATDAGVKLSPYVASAKRKPSTTRRKRQSATGANGTKNAPSTPTGQSDEPDEVMPGVPAGTPTLSWAQMLLSKFPSFDPAWPDDVKAKWFDAFEQLMARGES